MPKLLTENDVWRSVYFEWSNILRINWQVATKGTDQVLRNRKLITVPIPTFNNYRFRSGSASIKKQL